MIAKKDSNSSLRVIHKPCPHVGAKQPLKILTKKKTLTTNNGKVELTKKEKIKFVTSIDKIQEIKLKIESQRL